MSKYGPEKTPYLHTFRAVHRLNTSINSLRKSCYLCDLNVASFILPTNFLLFYYYLYSQYLFDNNNFLVFCEFHQHFCLIFFLSFLVISLENAIFTFGSLVVGSLTVFLALCNMLISFVKSFVPAWMIVISVWYLIKQENAMRRNNRDDLLQLSFTFKISIFSEV